MKTQLPEVKVIKWVVNATEMRLIIQLFSWEHIRRPPFFAVVVHENSTLVVPISFMDRYGYRVVKVFAVGGEDLYLWGWYLIYFIQLKVVVEKS